MAVIFTRLQNRSEDNLFSHKDKLNVDKSAEAWTWNKFVAVKSFNQQSYGTYFGAPMPRIL